MQEVAHRKIPPELRPWLALLVVAAACAGILVAGEPGKLALRYERDALLDGQLWRALTGHLVHLSWMHRGLDVAAAALIVAVFGRHVGWAAPLLCMLGTTAGLFLFSLRVKWYAGLSGALYGLAVYGALCAARRRRAWLAVPALLAVRIAVDIRGVPADCGRRGLSVFKAGEQSVSVTPTSRLTLVEPAPGQVVAIIDSTGGGSDADRAAADAIISSLRFVTD